MYFLRMQQRSTHEVGAELIIHVGVDVRQACMMLLWVMTSYMNEHLRDMKGRVDDLGPRLRNEICGAII